MEENRLWNEGKVVVKNLIWRGNLNKEEERRERESREVVRMYSFFFFLIFLYVILKNPFKVQQGSQCKIIIIILFKIRENLEASIRIIFTLFLNF